MIKIFTSFANGQIVAIGIKTISIGQLFQPDNLAVTGTWNTGENTQNHT
jgi:hypothetical protein